MTVLWSPAKDAGTARWLTLARAAALSDEARSSDFFSERGLSRMFVPARQGGATASLTAVVAVLEFLAVPCPQMSVLLAAGLVGTLPVLRLGSPKQKKEWLAPTDEGRLLTPVLAGPVDAVIGDATFTAVDDGKSWLLRGRGHWLGAGHAAGAFVLFAAHPQRRSRQLSALLIPRSTAGLVLDGSGSTDERMLTGLLSLDARIAAPMLLGAEGGASAVMEEVLALRRVAAAAQSVGVAISAYEEACLLASGHRGGGASRAVSKLVSCATEISAARMMLYQAAQAAQAGENVSLLSAMAMLSAGECADRVLSASLQIASSTPSTDPARLQAMLRARQLHQVTAGAPEAQALLLSDAILPPPSGSSAVDASTMPSNPPARQTPGRVAEILDAAADAFTQQSYDATTLDYIGDAIGVSKGSIYHHYRSKADLFVAVYRRAMEMNLDTVEPIARQSGIRAIDRLYRMAYAHSLQVMKHLSYQRLAVQGLEAHLMGRVTDEQRSELNDVISLRDRYELLFVGAIKQSIDAGELPQQDPKLAVKPLFGAINHTTMWYQPRAGETAADRERIATHLATFVISGLMQSHHPQTETATPPLAETA
jgi:alkylation response protein AidB-like acyl-CoA dehydrogenase/AcrR family transcriptional regulator